MNQRTGMQDSQDARNHVGQEPVIASTLSGVIIGKNLSGFPEARVSRAPRSTRIVLEV